MRLPCSPRQGLPGHVCPRSIALGRLSARSLRVDNEFSAFYAFLAFRTNIRRLPLELKECQLPVTNGRNDKQGRVFHTQWKESHEI
jgi:hypothetical protein